MASASASPTDTNNTRTSPAPNTTRSTPPNPASSDTSGNHRNGGASLASQKRRKELKRQSLEDELFKLIAMQDNSFRNLLVSSIHRALRIMISWTELVAFVREVYQRISELPIVTFYQYLWRTDKPQFVMTLFINYVFPMILESMPWYFSRRMLGKRLREQRNQIQHNMVNGKAFELDLVKTYVGCAAIHSCLETLDRHLKNKVTVVNRLIVKRMVLERILFSEVWALEATKVEQLENKIVKDISGTLNLFGSTIPQLCSTVYAFVRESTDLYRRRKLFHVLSVLRPTVSLILWKSVSWFKFNFLDKKHKKISKKNERAFTDLFSIVLDSLTDVQLYNIQRLKLQEFDDIKNNELSVQDGVATFLNRIFSNFTARGIFDFLSDVYITHQVMERKGVNHQQYRKMQIDIDHTIRLMRRSWNLLRTSKKVLDNQDKIIKLLKLPNFQDEEELQHPFIDVHSFREIRLRKVMFKYDDTTAPALDFEQEIKIESGKKYAIVGQNRSGKSTLVHIICKLYAPQQGQITWNGIPYADISRVSLRNLVSYVAQKPFIFPGTIMDNIRIGNLDASIDDVIEAAALAAIFTFDEVEIIKSSETNGSTDAATPQPGEDREDQPWNPSSCVDEAADESADEDDIGTSFYSYHFRDSRFYESTRIEDEEEEEEQSATPAEQGEESEAFEDKSEAPAQSITLPPPSALLEAAPPRLRSSSSMSEASGAGGGTGGGGGGGVRSKMRVKQLSKEGKLKILRMEAGERGSNLSGGFAQSVALARVFLRRNAKIVILDESLSAMDPIKKREFIMPRLLDFVNKHAMTMIMISHDMSFVSYVNHIFVMDKGKVVHSGSHQQLLDQRAEQYLALLGKDV